MSEAIKVLIVDDSAFARSVIAKKLDTDPGIAVAGFARDGADALEKIRELKPDVVTMDITMPEMDGLTALEHIMAGNPLPVIMLSALTGPQTHATITALELGAVDFFLKPSVANPAGTDESTLELIQKIKTAAAVPGKRLVPSKKIKGPRRPGSHPTKGAIPNMVNVLVIGSSTGGPRALAELIPDIPPNLPTGILIVQHMPPGFTQSLAQRLDQLSQLHVKEAEDGDVVKPGQALMAPGDYHMAVNRDGIIELNQDPPVCGVRPSVDVTIESVVRAYGSSSLAVVLTGMGSDGAKGAAMIKAVNGQVKVEHESTCAVYGMPKCIADAGNADKIVPLNRMAREIVDMCL